VREVRGGDSCSEAFGGVMVFGVCYAFMLPFMSITFAVGNLLGCKCFGGGLRDEKGNKAQNAGWKMFEVVLEAVPQVIPTRLS
jgi:hypothetical protein